MDDGTASIASSATSGYAGSASSGYAGSAAGVVKTPKSVPPDHVITLLEGGWLMSLLLPVSLLPKPPLLANYQVTEDAKVTKR